MADDTPYQQVDNTVDLPADVLETITRSCAGHVDGDLSPDVALLAGQRVFVAFGVASHRLVLEVEEAGWAYDIALTATTAFEPHSRIAVTRADGLFLVAPQAGPGNPASWTLEQVLAGDASLLGGTRVRSADLDGNGRSDLMVVLADMRTVRVLLRQLDGSWDGSLTPFTLPTQVRELGGLQYDEDPALEIAVQVAGSARVHELDGTFVAMARNHVSGAPAAMAVLPVAGTPRSRVAYLATAEGGGYDLHVLEHGLALASLFVGELLPRSLLAADHDLDGDFDLLVDRGESGMVVLLANSEADYPAPFPDPTHPFSFFHAHALEFHVGPQEGLSQRPCWSDLDNDAWPDLFVPGGASQAPSRLEFRPGDPAQMPEGEGVGGQAHPIFLDAHWAQPDAQHAPQLRLRVADVWNDTRGHLQVTVWRQENPPSGGPVTGTERFGRFNGFYAKAAVLVEGVDAFEFTLPFDSSVGSPQNETPFQLVGACCTPAAGGTDSTVYFVEVRSAQLDPVSLQILSVGRTQTAGLALNWTAPIPSGTAFSYLQGQPGSWPGGVTTTIHSAGFGGGLGDFKIGGLVPMPATPEFAPGFLVYKEPTYFQ